MYDENKKKIIIFAKLGTAELHFLKKSPNIRTREIFHLYSKSKSLPSCDRPLQSKKLWRTRILGNFHISWVTSLRAVHWSSTGLSLFLFKTLVRLERWGKHMRYDDFHCWFYELHKQIQRQTDRQTEIAKTEGPIDFFSYFFLNFFFDKRSNRDREWERDTKRDKEWQSVNKKYWLSNLQEKTMSYKTKQLQSHQRCSSCTTLSATKITFDFANTNTYTWSH